MNAKLLPLALLEANDEEPVEGITRFMKLVFLAQEEEELGQEFYEYEAGQYGPYSKELYDDLDKLEARRFVEKVPEPTRAEKDKQVYKLAPKGKNALEGARESDDLSELAEAVNHIKGEYNAMGLWELLEYVYGEYPEMAANSVLDISPRKAV